MRVKRYEAESMQEAILKVRGELGRDAVILHSKKFRRGGVFGLFGRPVYEVIAAVDLPGEPAVKERVCAEVAAVAGAASAAPAGERRVGSAPPGLRPAVQVGRVTVPVGPEARSAQVPGGPPRAAAVASAAGLAEDLAGLRQMIHELSQQLADQGAATPLAPGWEEVRRRLEAAGLLPEYLKEIESEVFRRCRLEELKEPARVEEVVHAYFLQNLDVERRSAATANGRRVIALIGPTGVGKTTTVAKLAAQYALFGNRSVGLLTVDTYRIAAVEQLKTYAEIIKLPVEVAFSPDEVREALARLEDREIVLMDTAGRSQKNGGQMEELRAYLEAAEPDEVHLVLSATTKQRDLDDCLRQFKDAGYERLIFTKLDETDAYGSIFNCAKQAGCPVTYLTFGQNVPQDIEEASRERLADLLLGTGAWR